MVEKQEYVKSPLNYTGGKYKILDSIFQYFPSHIDTFVDLFGGGFNVGINVDAKKIIYNDHITYLKEMFEFFKEAEYSFILENIKARICEFNLDSQNVEGYLKLREKYNRYKNILDLFVLTCYSFNHQIRFNNKLEFNTPFGKNRSIYNSSIEKNLFKFIFNLKNKNIEFFSNDFSYIKNYSFKYNDFIYCDPPYLISNACYNDGKRGFGNWTQNKDKELLDLLDYLNKKGIKFLLSNVLMHKGNVNENLIKWSHKYNVKYINKKYNNCNYQLKSKKEDTQEVVIYNYN